MASVLTACHARSAPISSTWSAGARSKSSSARNAHHLESGRLTLEQVALAEFRSERRFDKAFSVNVNVFWTTTAAAECQALSAVLAPRGVVHLVFGGPDDLGSGVSDRVVANLGRQGFAAIVRRGPHPSLVCITGRPTGETEHNNVLMISPAGGD